MKITIEGDFGDSDIIFSNEELDNSNFVEFYTELKAKNTAGEDVSECSETYTVSVEDLYRTAELFNNIRLERRAEDED